MVLNRIIPTDMLLCLIQSISNLGILGGRFISFVIDSFKPFDIRTTNKEERYKRAYLKKVVSREIGELPLSFHEYWIILRKFTSVRALIGKGLLGSAVKLFRQNNHRMEECTGMNRTGRRIGP